MQGASLEILEKAAVPPTQARAIVQAIEIEIAGARDTLVTKQDLLVFGHGLELKLEGLRADLRSEIQGLRSELRGEIQNVCGALHGEVQGVRVEMHGMASTLMRHMYTAMLGQLAVLLGVTYVLVSHVPR